MKIIHCLNQYMPLSMAGTEIYVHTLATIQKSKGYEVAVLTPHIEHYRPEQINEHYVYDGMDVYQFLEEADPTDRQIHYGKKKPEGLHHFISFINRYKPGIIHFHELNRSIGFTVEHVKLAKASGAKVFLTMHLSSYSCNTNVLIYNKELCDGLIRNFKCTACSYKTLFRVPYLLAKPLAALSVLANKVSFVDKLPSGKGRTLLSVSTTIKRIKNDLDELVTNVDQLISYSNWYKKILLFNGVPSNKITVVPSALVTLSTKMILKNFKQPQLPIKLVFVGRIQPTKGIHIIIEAMNSFTEEQVQIYIYGKPEGTLYYQQCIKDTNNKKSINWMGEISRDEVVQRISQYDIFCLASTFSEMSPLVIQEAFAAGIPILASKVYGNVEQIQDGYNGLLFTFNSSVSLKNQIQKLIDNPSLLQQLKKNITAPANFNLVSDAYFKLYAHSR